VRVGRVGFKGGGVGGLEDASERIREERKRRRKKKKKKKKKKKNTNRRAMSVSYVWYTSTLAILGRDRKRRKSRIRRNRVKNTVGMVGGVYGRAGNHWTGKN
jgi:hypothetical protein